MEQRRRASDRGIGRGRLGLVVVAVVVAWALGARPAHAGRDHHFGPRLDVWLGIPPVVVDPGYQYDYGYDYGYGHYPRGHGHHHYGGDDSDSDSDSGHRHHRDCR